MSRARVVILALVAVCLTPVASAPAAGSDPYCTSSYGAAVPRHGADVRFGVDPGLAGSVGGAQLPSVADNPARDLEEVQALRPKGRAFAVRLNRLFWSDGDAGIATFKQVADTYSRAGLDVELQVRYHPPSGEAGDIAGWEQYVRHVVDVFGPNSHVIAMTITNEVNVQFSPNTSDGYYQRAQDALIAGIEAAHAEARKHHFRQLRFGFTYAYRFAPNQDAAFFDYLRSHGGGAFRAALGFVGLDFYPGTVYPPAMQPGDSYRAELAQAAGVLRDCFAPQAGIADSVPIWITENGVPTGTMSEAQQAAALRELVQATSDYSGTYNITDYRWFNLRDSSSGSPANLVGPTFSSDGLLRSDYSAKPAFGDYRMLIAALGAREPPAPKHKHKRHKRRRRHRIDYRHKSA